MSRQTSNFGWTVPELSDPKDITKVSEAFDGIDSSLKQVSDTASGAIMLSSPTTQIVDSDIAMGVGSKLLGIDSGNQQHTLISHSDYGGGVEQTEVGNEIHHTNINSLDRPTVETSNGKEEVAYLSDISAAGSNLLYVMFNGVPGQNQAVSPGQLTPGSPAPNINDRVIAQNGALGWVTAVQPAWFNVQFRDNPSVGWVTEWTGSDTTAGIAQLSANPTAYKLWYSGAATYSTSPSISMEVIVSGTASFAQMLPVARNFSPGQPANGFANLSIQISGGWISFNMNDFDGGSTPPLITRIERRLSW